MTNNPPQPFYDAPIDRNHSVAFSYTAHTTNSDLIECVESVWYNFPEETRVEINPVGPNSKALGLPTLRLIVIQLFSVWITDPTLALATPRGNDLKVKSIYNGAVRLMIASIRLMGQSKFMRSIVDATQPEQRHGLARRWCVNRDGVPD
jgi:hypothetical protein